ncbi:MAG: carbon-nitrogen hydrolase family protein [Pseudomonadota bacterium]
MRVALVQLISSDDPRDNLRAATELIRRAAANGAALVATPEVTNCVSLSRDRQRDVLRTEADDPVLAGLRDLAAELSVHLLIGSLALRTDGPRFANRSVLVGPAGEIRARYDKIHMFDVQIGPEEVYRESDSYRPGTEATLASLGAATLGLSICYDLRFPHLYRALAQAGAGIIAVPSAFTRPTGAAHWEVLLRARAIETGCFVIAPAQTGRHPAQPGLRRRETHGHSMIIDPWGRVLLNMGTPPGTAAVDLDLAQIAKARARIPALIDQPFDPPAGP